MRYPLRLIAVVAALLLGSAVPTLQAQDGYPKVKVAGRLQEQFYYFGNEDYAAATGSQSNFFTRRARIQAQGQIAENIYFIVMPSFEDGFTRLRLRDAFIDVRLTKPDAGTVLALRAGQEKRPFGRYELTSSNNLPSIERGAGKGLVKAGSNDLFTGAGYMSHDVGGALMLATALGNGRAVTLHAGVYNGAGESVSDNNDGKSFGARATVDVTGKLNLGGSVFSHDGIVGADSSFRNTAWGVDAAWGNPGEAGLYLVGDYMQGERANATKDPMRGVSLVGAYHLRLRDAGSWLLAVEPMARVDLADPDTDTADDGSTLFTGGLGFYLSSKAIFRVAYEHQSFQAAGAPSISGVRTALTVSF